MKKYLCSMGAWVALTALTASGQTSSSGGSQSTSGTSQGTTSTSQGTSSSQQNQQNLPPGLQNRDQLPPGLQNRDQLPPGLANRTNNVSNFGVTNQFGGTSRFGTNNPLYPTGRFGDTNRTYGTNSGFRGGSSYGTNGSSHNGQHDSYGENEREGRTQHRDEAVTPQDRTLLITIRQKVQTEVRAITSAQGAWAPVNFKCDRGIVTIFGTVQTIEIKQEIEQCVRRVPGVVRVEDSIIIAGAGGGVEDGGSDQVLVTRVRERVMPQIQVTGIDFQCHNGVVTVIGSVPQPEVKERLISLVREVPGVVNVTDQITVNAEVQGQARFEQSEQTRVGQPEQTRPGQFEQRREGQSERDRAVSAGVETSKTNLPPTGRENSLPPGLEKKDQLPPGLEKRNELPPGLSKGTNNPAQPKP